MTTSSTLKSGNSYCLQQLFSVDNKVIIPDLQRDYTWGDEIHGAENKELVTDFCNDLYRIFKENNGTEIQLGMILAYENPTHYINIADGQQRLTTLFLLIGILYRKTKEGKLKECLISDFELNKDDQEPFLQYTIRESTLYFLSDLTVEYFIKGTNEKIKSSNWYFSEYNNDPSIQSMLKALTSIENMLNDKVNLSEFSEWLISKVDLLYVDVKDRKHGEETYIVINTTGEPLTPTENLKPLLLGAVDNDKFNREWEEREDFFWKNKKEKEYTADNGVTDFITWFLKAKTKKDKVHLLEEFQKTKNKVETLKEIENYFQALKTLLNFLELDRFQKIFKQIKDKENLNLTYLRDLYDSMTNNVLVPLLAYIVKNCDEDSVYNFLRRLRKNYFDKIWEYLPNRKEKYIKFDDILKNIECPSEITNWNDEDEQFKNMFDSQIIEELENHQYLGGRLDIFRTLLEGENDLELLQQSGNIFKSLPFHDDDKKLWRLLLTYTDFLQSSPNDLIKDDLWQKMIFSENSKYLMDFIGKILKEEVKIENIEEYLANYDCSLFQEKWREVLIKSRDILKETSRVYHHKDNDSIRLQNKKSGGTYRTIFPERDKFFVKLKENINGIKNFFIDKEYEQKRRIQIKIEKNNAIIELFKDTGQSLTFGVLKTNVSNSDQQQIKEKFKEISTKNEIIKKLKSNIKEDNEWWLLVITDNWNTEKEKPELYGEAIKEIYQYFSQEIS